MIPFNKPFLTGKEMHYMYQAVYSGKISGNGIYTQKCQKYFEEKYGFRKTLLTTSCTDALEMSAMLSGVGPGDEVIVPSYTFVSSAIAFSRQGAKVVFCDSSSCTPNMDCGQIEKLITDRTKVIVVVHYAGIACDMDKVMELAKKHDLIVVEDAAQAVNSFYKGKALGSIGHMSAFSFHETKNINSGEGGMLVINDERFIHRAEIIWEKGTNRNEYFRGMVNKYECVDIGSSFLPSEIIAAYLFAQIENLDVIQQRRMKLSAQYRKGLTEWSAANGVTLPYVPEWATDNGHMFYMVCSSLEQRTALIAYLLKNEVCAVFHYLSLHKSPYYAPSHNGAALPESDRYTDCLVRLPLFYELSDADQQDVIAAVKSFGKQA